MLCDITWCVKKLNLNKFAFFHHIAYMLYIFAKRKRKKERKEKKLCFVVVEQQQKQRHLRNHESENSYVNNSYIKIRLPYVRDSHNFFFLFSYSSSPLHYALFICASLSQQRKRFSLNAIQLDVGERERVKKFSTAICTWNFSSSNLNSLKRSPCVPTWCDINYYRSTSELKCDERDFMKIEQR